jgi:hypothetical protein
MHQHDLASRLDTEITSAARLYSSKGNKTIPALLGQLSA